MPIQILVVDDDPAIRQVIKLGLERLGPYSVHAADNGKEGLKLARQLKPEFIILDIRMPDMNGIEVLRALKKEYPLSQIPVLMLSGMADEEIRRQCNYEYCEEFLGKPFQLADLKERIESILGLGRKSPPPEQ